MWRRLNQDEVEIISALLAGNPIAQKAWFGSAGNFTCEELDEFGSIALVKDGSTRPSGQLPTASGYQRDPADLDGAPIEFVLFAVGELLTELQIYKADGTELRSPPKAAEIVLY